MALASPPSSFTNGQTVPRVYSHTMHKVNTDKLNSTERASPKGKYGAYVKHVSIALGREDGSTDLMKRHPFDVAIVTIPPGKAYCPYHCHSAQWEFYHVLSGAGKARHEGGATEIGPGDAFIFKPGEAHQILNDGDQPLVYYVVADNPLNESCYYPDSGKWLVRSPHRHIMRGENLDYLDGEE